MAEKRRMGPSGEFRHHSRRLLKKVAKGPGAVASRDVRAAHVAARRARAADDELAWLVDYSVYQLDCHVWQLLVPRPEVSDVKAAMNGLKNGQRKRVRRSLVNKVGKPRGWLCLELEGNGVSEFMLTLHDIGDYARLRYVLAAGDALLVHAHEGAGAAHGEWRVAASRILQP